MLTGMDPDTYIKHVRLGQTDAIQAITIGTSGSDKLEITLSSNGGSIEGLVTDAAAKPVIGAPVILIPEKRDRRDLYKTATSAPDGRFSLRGIAPGEYRVFAWENLEPFSYFDPDVLKMYEQQGKLVRVQDTTKETIDVQVIAAQ
jgi:hypothetical protein